MQVFPAIDLKDGCCVRLFKGDYEQQTIYSDDPLQLAKDFECAGFTALHVVDLDGARDGIQKNAHVVQKIAAQTQLSVQLGGGIRDASTFRRWLDCGVNRCVIGSQAVTEPDMVKSWLREFGPSRTVLAFDVRINGNGVPMLATHGWKTDSNVSLWDCVQGYQAFGLSRVLCTDIDRDGALTGPNIALYRTFIERFPRIELQASGGVRSASDLHELRKYGMHSVITGRALLDGRISDKELQQFLPAA
jgi:phosphoribosylformimino-5-aminoimidazole carboxamide ribotide isomerase